MPTGTVITAYTFNDLGQTHNSDKTIKDNTVLKTEGSTATPYGYKDRSVSVRRPFLDRSAIFLYDETYLISAMYYQEFGNDEEENHDSLIFSMASTSLNPLFVPSY